MAFIKGIAAGAAGAAAYNLYHEVDISPGKDIASGLFEAFQRKGAAQVAEMSRMHRQVDDLQSALLKALHDKTQPTVIVQGSGRPSGSTVTGAIVVVGGVVLYLRFVRGWRFSDMMYVTKGALTAMQETVTASLTNMKVQVEAATAELVARMSTVADKQDDMLQRQEDMDGQLQDVGERVEHVQGGIAVLQHQAAYTNHAITMLCGALSEVAKRVGLGNGRYVRALDNIVHGAPQPAQQRIEGSSGGAMAALPSVEGMLLLEPAITEVESLDASAPRPNPAVFALNGNAGGGRAAAAVAAGAVPRIVPSHPGGSYAAVGTTSFSGGSTVTPPPQPGAAWGRSTSVPRP